MDGASVLNHCMALLAGELRDSSGAVLVPAASPPVLVEPDDAHRATAATALSSGRRVVVPIPTGSPALAGRVAGWLTCRLRVARAKRWLTSAGATRVRTLGVVPGRESLFVVYELGGSLQPYVEQYVVLRTQGAARWTNLAKSAIARVMGADISVSLIVVVGEIL